MRANCVPPPPLLLAAICLFAAVACGGSGNTAATPPTTGTASAPSPTLTLVFTSPEGDTAELMAEVADTAEERARGLQFREHLPEDRGMLFVFGGETQADFWMKDTFIPLSIAFISAEGLVLEVQDMEPLTKNLHTPAAPYFYAVEVNRGWFQRHSIGVGSTVDLPPAE